MKTKSIRFRLILWFAIILVVTVLITFLAIRTASGMVLKGTIRNYLITMVEENTDKILYVDKKPEVDTGANIYIPYGDGQLEIDADFLDVVNDVYAALYTSDGKMIYGENPLEKETTNVEFTESYIWSFSTGGVEYMIYDRSLGAKLPDNEVLWIRGVVPETKSELQLDAITRISALLIPILSALMALLMYLVIDKSLKPLREIEETADHISRGEDLKERIELAEREDEVGMLAKAFNRMFDRLNRSFEVEKQFTQDASHELRTPTSVIMAQSEYILEKDRTNQEYKEALEVIHRQSSRMNDLIGDMLDYTRMNQLERYKMEEVDLSDVTREMVNQMVLIGDKSISMSTGIQHGIKVIGNAMLLGRLVQNLVGNAYRYGNENGNIAVDLFSEENEEGRKVAKLSVSDDGPGIDKEDLDKIFDRFYRGDSSRSNQGTGLGLAMVKKIAEIHGGEVTVESEVGKGSTFKVIIPLIKL